MKWPLEMARPRKLPDLATPAAVSIPPELWDGNCGPETVRLFDMADLDPEPAREVCLGCPVLNICLGHALEAEPYGVWGGKTAEERNALRGEPLPYTLEQRRERDVLIEMLSQGRPRDEMATRFDVDIRSIDRIRRSWLETA